MKREFLKISAGISLSLVLAFAIGCGDKKNTTTNNGTNTTTNSNTSTNTTNTGTTTTRDTMPKSTTNKDSVEDAEVKIAPLGTSKVEGDLDFEAVDGGVKITGKITGLTPGDHGIHVHEFGNCNSPDGKSAGEHFNPTKSPHGGPNDAAKHPGDMGNITADKDGVAKIDVTVKGMMLTGPNSIVGKSVVVHEKKDDLKTQPSGDSGARLGCGVIVAD